MFIGTFLECTREHSKNVQTGKRLVFEKYKHQVNNFVK